MAVISILGWFIAKIYGFVRGVKSFFNPQSKTTGSSADSRRDENKSDKSEKQIISDDEGEYVDFEEVKE